MRKSGPFFSIIIPTLNEEKYLPKLLFSLLIQKEKDFEILVVDGKSDDRTVEVAKRFERNFNKINKKFRIIKSLKRNVSYQRNLGAKQAHGKWLVFFDADVWFEKDYLFQIKKEILKKDLKFLTTWTRAESQEKEDEALTMFGNAVVSASVVVDKPLVPGFCFFVKREIFEKVGGFDEELKIAEDYELAYRIYKKENLFPLVLRKPQLFVSLRRYQKEGKIQVLAKYTKVAVNILIRGNHVLRKKIVDYPMGGSYHLTDFKKKSFWERIKERISNL